MQAIENTPGIYYAIAYLLSTTLVIICSPKRLRGYQTVLVQIVFGVLLTTIMVASDGITILFVPCMILYVVMFSLTIYINCTYDFKTAVYFAFHAFIMGEFAASFEWQVLYYAAREFKIPHNIWVDIGFLVAVHSVIFILLYLLERRNRHFNKTIVVDVKELLSAAVITLAVFVVSNLSYLASDSIFSSQFANEIFIIRTLVDLGGVAILYAYHTQLGELNYHLEAEKLQDMLNMQYSNYEMLEQSIAVVNQKYHDLKYQIEVLKQEANKEESLRYLDEMEREISLYEAQNKTGNKVLDTILTGKSIHCKNNWIELTCVADGSAVDFMEPMDISTLFGNMLDNAIESVSKVKQKERRLIHLAVTKQKGFVRIREENYYDDELRFENGMPTTTKKDSRYHGFGLKSIKSTAKKYGGSVTIDAKDGWFELRILIPLPKEKTENEQNMNSKEEN